MTAIETAFVLPGGASGGAAQVGILQALLEAGIVPDVVVGCSVGAINGALLALEPTVAQAHRLADVWRSIERSDVFGTRGRNLVRLALRREHAFEPSPLRALIDRFCPMNDLSETAIPLHVGTTNLDHGVVRWWTSGPACEVLYASACLPGLFPPIVLGGDRHVDGGVLEPVPVARGVDTGARRVYVLGDIDPPALPSPERPTALDVLLRAFAVSRYARVPDPESLARPGQRVITVPGADTVDIDPRDFTQSARLIGDSRAIAAAFLAEASPLRLARHAS